MKSIGYSIMALIFFYLFLMVQFPYGALQEYLAQNFGRLNMGRINIGKVSLSFPFDISLQNISWTSENLGMQFPDLIMGVNIMETLFGNMDIEIKALKNPRRLQGRYEQSVKEGSLRLRLDHPDLKVAYKNGYSLTISISGEAQLRWLGENYEKLNGELWALLQRGEIEIKQEKNLPSFLKAYDRLRAEVQIQDGTLWAKRLVISGREGKEIVLRDLSLPDILNKPGLNLSAILSRGLY